ncbi:MAG: hypothetical protein PHR61_01275 [Candidatus Absconditabacteria bacterium]|nr:hypothetical protein [Candidatus Absconditabacteria bacterium]
MNNVIESKDINIIKLSTKPRDVINIDDYDIFQNELAINNILDPLKDTEIRKYGNHFFFSKNGKELFSLKSEKTFLDFLNEFYNQQETVEKQILVDLNNLKLSIYVGDPSIVGVKEQEQIDKLTKDIDINTLVKTTEKLKATLEDQEKSIRGQGRRFNFKGMKNTKEERELWKQYEKQIDARLREIKKIEQNIQKLDEGGTEYEDVNDYRALNGLPQIASKLRELSSEVVDIDDALLSLSLGKLPESVYFDYKIRGKKAAEKLRDSMINFNEELIAITTATHTAAGERLRQEDLTSLQKYLNGVINGEIDPATQAFTAEQERAFKYLRTIDPTLQDTFDALPATGRKARRAQKAAVSGNVGTGNVGDVNTTGNTNIVGGGAVGGNNPESQKISDQQDYKDRNEALANGGAYGLLDHATKGFQDQSPRAQQFYRNFGNMALVAGGVFVGLKVIKSLWRIVTGKADGTKNERAWVLGTAGVLLATAGRPQDLFRGGYPSEMLSNFFNRVGIGKKNDSFETTPQAVVAAMALFNGKNYGQIRDMLTQENGKMKIDPNKYDQMIVELNTIIAEPNSTPEQKTRAELQLKFLQTVGKEDKNGFVDHALTSVGLTWEELIKTENRNQSFDKDISKVMERIVLINQKMGNSNNPYKSTNPEMDANIQSYISKGTPSLEDLEAMGAFEKNVNISAEEQTRLRTMIEELGVTDVNKKEQILQGLYQFYMDRPTTDPTTKAGLKIENDGGRISLSTYGQKTRIDIENKSILTEGGSINFASTKELLKAASLTNRLKEITKPQDIGEKEKPFDITTRGNIKFNDTERYEPRKLDTTLVKENSLREISPTLSDKKDQYVAYLNDRWKHKEELNYVPTAVIAAAVVTTTEVDEDADKDLSGSAETPEQKAEREKKEIETLKTNLSAKITDLEDKINISLIDQTKKSGLITRLNNQKTVNEKADVTSEDLEKAVSEVEKIEEELKTLEEEKIENENKPVSEEKINKLLVPTLLKDVFNNERKEKNDITYVTIQNPFLKVSFDNPIYNTYPTGYGPSAAMPTYNHYYLINLNQILTEDGGINESTLNKLINEKKGEREKIMKINETARNCLQEIKDKEYEINDLFENYNAINHPGHVSFFSEFDDNILEFDKSGTKQRSDGSDELLLTFDDSWGNEDYNKNISIKLESITENGEFKEEKFKNELRKIINDIVEGNFK